MKKSKTLLVSLMMIFSSVAAPATLLANDSIQAANASVSTSIRESNVWWDLYYMYKDKWLEEWNANNPDSPREEFNPFYLTPNYGDYRGKDSKGRMLTMYPYQNDIYIYTWFNSSEVTVSEWNGSSLQIYGTTNTLLNEGGTGYDDDGEMVNYEATIVNSYGHTGDRSNWLGKYVIENVIDNSDDNEAYRFYVKSMSWGVSPAVGNFDCGDEILYQKTETLNDFIYQYKQPDYIDITAKTGTLMLSGENWESELLGPFFKYDENNVEVRMLPTSSGQLSRSVSGFNSYDENFYAFFNTGNYVVDGVEYDNPINSIEEITYSYTTKEYSHVSSQFVRFGWSDSSLAFKGLYDKEYLHEDAYFTNIKKPVASGDNVVKSTDVTTTRNNFFNIFGFGWETEYSTMGIIDCSGDTNIPGDDEFNSLKTFVEKNRGFDSDGDGVIDKQYRWAFKVGQMKRTSETINYGTAVVTAWGNWKTKAHQIDDITILRVKFINTENHQFDLLAMDVNTPTNVVQVVTGGKMYTVVPKWFQDFVDFLSGVGNVIGPILIAALVIALVIGLIYILQPVITFASNESVKNTVRKNNNKKKKK